MEREKLDEILTELTNISKANDMQEGIQLFDKLCELIGYPKIPLEDLINSDNQDIFQQELKKCISFIETKIKVEDVDYFYSHLDEEWIVFIRDDKKIEQLERITNENYKVYVIGTIEDDGKREALLTELTAGEHEPEEKTSESKDTLQEVLEKNEYSLTDKQKAQVRNLYEKNNDLLETINFKILDEKYADLEDKLSIITSYQDIQQQIINLDDMQYKIFITTLKEHEERNGEWINFASKIISNLYSRQYEALLSDIKDKELTKEEIRTVGNILSKENIFNIKNLEEAKRYEEIKNQVCELIIKDSNFKKLEQYPNIMMLSDISRKKLAVLQKVYGQTLEEAMYLLDIYGADVDNLKITDENKSYIEYIKSLQIIEETGDIELLKKIYEKSETITLDNIYDVEMIEEGLKNAYLETYNEKLYQPKEKDLLQTIEENGQEIPIYDAGTEFSMSVSSISAYVRETELDSYKEDWNRPKTASQGFCTSYVRNDMLATATISNVLYGFINYDEGTLMKAGREPLGSDASKFKIEANFVKFLSEDEMINYTNQLNELLFNRNNAKGERKQPDYIVFIKERQEVSGYVWENTKKAAAEFGIPIVIIDKEKCAKSEEQKISSMLDEFIKKGDNELLQKACQKFSNNKEGNSTYFTEEKWKTMCQEKGIENIPSLPNREEEFLKKCRRTRAHEKRKTEDEKQDSEESEFIQYEELKENYEQTNQTEKEKAMAELKKRAKLIIKMSQQEMEGQEDVSK